MSDEIKKFREFWIEEYDDSPSIAWEGPEDIDYKENATHVVEYSALEAAQAEIEELKQISSRNADNWVTFLKRSTALEARETELLNLVREMREALESIAALHLDESKIIACGGDTVVTDTEIARETLTKAHATLKKLGVTE